MSRFGSNFTMRWDCVYSTSLQRFESHLRATCSCCRLNETLPSSPVSQRALCTEHTYTSSNIAFACRVRTCVVEGVQARLGSLSSRSWPGEDSMGFGLFEELLRRTYGRKPMGLLFSQMALSNMIGWSLCTCTCWKRPDLLTGCELRNQSSSHLKASLEHMRAAQPID